jgi:ribosomal protein L24
MLRRVLETYNDGFEPNKARRALCESVRFWTSTDGNVSAAGVLGRITVAKISVSKEKQQQQKKKKTKLTTLAKEIHVAFICLFARFLARFLEYASLLPCNGMNDV